MRIEVKSDGHNITVPIPTRLIFSKVSVWAWLKIMRSSAGKHIPDHVMDGMDGLSDQAVYALCNEILRIKKRYGSWNLVELKSSDGTQVLIRL